MKIQNKEELLRYIRTGLRLNTPAPRVEKDKTKYNRKDKHKKNYKENSYDN